MTSPFVILKTLDQTLAAEAITMVVQSTLLRLDDSVAAERAAASGSEAGYGNFFSIRLERQ